MSAFAVEFNNEPGQLAHLCEAMAARQINLVMCGTTRGDSGTVAFIADDESAAQAVLGGAGVEFTEREALTVRMANAPGAGAATFRKLADAGVTLLEPPLDDPMLDQLVANVCRVIPPRLTQAATTPVRAGTCPR